MSGVVPVALKLRQMKRLLLNHPNPEVEQAVSRTLGRIGTTIDVSNDPEEVLLQIAEHAYDVVIVDRTLARERLDHITAVLRERSNPKPIVIVTSTDETDLDPNVVSLIVPSSYDVATLVGVILACAAETPAIEAPEPLGPEITSQQ